MGGIGHTIRISGEGDASALHEAVWEWVQSKWSMWSVPGRECAGVESYLSGVVSDDREVWGASDSELSFVFRDPAGCCGRSCEAAMHWFELALATDWSGLCELADQHGFEVESAPIVPQARHFVRLRGDLWNVGTYEGSLYLGGDNDSLEVETLTAEERESVDLALKQCQCSACSMTRPDPPVVEAFVRALEAAIDPGLMGSVAWYARHMLAPPPELLLAMGQAATRAPAHSRPLLDTIEQLAPRLADLPPEAPLALKLALREGKGEFDRDELLSALAADPPASGLAAELAGRHLRDERDTLWAPMVAVLDRPGADEETRHRVVLALVNLFLPRGPVPPEVLELFRREAARDPDAPSPSAASLARWAVGVYGP